MYPATLAASMATGRHAIDHGIPAPNRADRDSPSGMRPVDSLDLRATPIWQLAADSGLSTAAVGWPVSHPANAFDGLIVSDVFAEAEGTSFDEWPLRADAISDASLRDELLELRLHPSEVTPDMVQPFIPHACDIDMATDERWLIVMAMLARAVSVHSAGVWILENRESDLLAIHFNLIETLTAGFLQFRAPQMPHVTDADFRVYRHVVDGAYQFFDMLLGRYLESIDADCSLLLASDHGFLMDEQRPIPEAPSLKNRVQPLYREHGVFLAAGPEVKQDELVFGARIFDVVPTALAMLGVPVSSTMEGHVLTEVFEEPISVNKVDDTSAPDFTARISGDRDSTLAHRRMIETATLGYHPLPPRDPELAFEVTEIRWITGLAQTFYGKGLHATALMHVQRLLELDPDNIEGLQLAAKAHLALGSTKSAREALDCLRQLGIRGAALDYFFARLERADGNESAAQAHLDAAAEAETGGVSGQRLLEAVGSEQLSTNELHKAEEAFRKALKNDPNSPVANNGLGIALLRSRHPMEAIEHFRRSLLNDHHQPQIHFYLGHCLRALGQPRHAAEAYRASLRLNPDFAEAKAALEQTIESLGQHELKKAVERWSE